MPPYSLGFIMKSLRISCQLFLYHTTLIGKSSVKPDLLANGGLILADGLCDNGFGGAVGNTGENDTPFLQS